MGPDLWANRLQDWCLRNGRITCVAPAGQRLVRTVALLTKRLNGGPARLVVQTGTNTTGTGFSRFLVGTGEPGTDYRRAALVMTASGQAGGLLCVYDADGRVRFRGAHRRIRSDRLRRAAVHAERPCSGAVPRGQGQTDPRGGPRNGRTLDR